MSKTHVALKFDGMELEVGTIEYKDGEAVEYVSEPININTYSGTVSGQIFRSGLRKMFNAVWPDSIEAKGYTIHNYRGRNKLVKFL